MRARLLTAAVGIPVLLLVVLAGVPWLVTLTAATVAVAGAWEFSRLLSRSGLPSQPWITLPWVGALVLSAHWGADTLVAATTAGLVSSLIALLLQSPSPQAATRWAAAVAATLYPGWLLAHAPLLYALPQGREWALLWLLTTFATDTGAFFTGSLLGRHPLAPAISPGKTWEGAVGGWATGVAAAVGLGFLLPLGIPWWQVLLLGPVVAVVAQLGDLVESLFKRGASVKEAGGLLPGHGGLLDRLDSLVLTLPVVYYGVIALVGRP